MSTSIIFNLSSNVHNRYYFDSWVHLLADVDGVRLITNDISEFLQKVPGRLDCTKPDY